MLKFKFLEHRADVYVVAYGNTLEKAFENAALATFEVMTKTLKVSSTIEETVEVEGYDEKSLLYNWLEALLVKFELTERLYSKFEVESIKKIGEKFSLKAKIGGERFNPEKHLQKVGVKAVTYHRMEILKENEEVAVKFILDI